MRDQARYLMAEMSYVRPDGVGVWEHFTMRDGLPDLKIECVKEDSRGVLWIGTHDKGVVCYEGDDFRWFTTRDGLAGNGVFSIVEDNEGCIWFGTNAGLSRTSGDGFESVELGEPCSFLWGGCTDTVGRLWFGLERRPGRPPAVCRWDGEEAEIVNLSDAGIPGGSSVHTVVPDEKGGIWCGGHGVYYCDDSGSRRVGELEPEDAGAVTALWYDRELLWLFGDRDLCVWDVESLKAMGRWPEFGSSGGICRGPTGDVWMTTTQGGVMCHDGEKLRLVDSLNVPLWHALSFDRLGRLWVGSYGYGLYCYDATRATITRTDQGLPSNSIRCLVHRDNEGLLIGTDTGWVEQVGTGFRRPEWGSEFEDWGVASLLQDKAGRVWVGTRSGHMHMFDGTHLRACEPVPQMLRLSIDSLAEDGEGRIWFGSRLGKGFGYYDGESVRYFAPGEGAAYPAWVGAMEIDEHGAVLIGSGSPHDWDGICRFNGESFDRHGEATGAPVHAVMEDREGRLWIGTNEGVSCDDGEYVVTYTQEDGLPCEIITVLYQSEDGRLWIGTEGGGVCCYDGMVFQTLQLSERPDCNVIRAICEDADGALWFGTQGGLIHYRPRVVQPTIDLTEVVADEVYDDPVELQISNTVGRVSFRFRGRSPLDRSRCLVYRYRLDGFDKDWRQTNLGEAEYPQLRSGDYEFTVQTVDRDMNYSEPAIVKLAVVEDPRIHALNEALRGEALQGEFIGESAAMKDVKRQIQEVAWTDLTVLVLGETGTGKGLAARGIHEASERRDGPFIHVQCGGLQEGLVDSELFGHERGAFTSAIARRLGKFELADGGTIFLDEIGDLPPESQTRLLGVLQERCFERVGGTQTINIDVRVIAATNRDLQEAVRANRYRADLYYRLNVFPLRIPHLRERREDTRLLAEYFVSQFSVHLNLHPPQISDEANAVLLAYEWPGNVRELEHTMQRAVILAREAEIRPEHLAIAPAPVTGEGGGLSGILPLAEHERRYLALVLEHTGGVIHGKSGAAQLLDIKPTTLRSRLEKLGLRKSEPRRGIARR